MVKNTHATLDSWVTSMQKNNIRGILETIKLILETPNNKPFAK